LQKLTQVGELGLEMQVLVRERKRALRLVENAQLRLETLHEREVEGPAAPSVVERADAAVAEAQAERDAAEARAQERDSLFADLVEQTVTLAIKVGAKKETERNAYRDSLMALPSQAVREVREAFAAVKAPKTTDKLVESMQERHKRTFGQTTVVETENGTRRADSGRKPRFAAAAK
jgi:hypothetical protein